LAARLDRDPIAWPGANPPELNGNVLRQTLLDSLYSAERFPALAELIRAARDGGPLPEPSSPPAEALQNTIAVSAATICNDVDWPTSMADYARDVAVSRARHPLTAGMPVNVTGNLRGCPGLQAGEESDSCGAGQGKTNRRQGDSSSTPHGGEAGHNGMGLSTVIPPR
jgi:hypothetical protein